MLSKTAEYALRAVAFLAFQPGEPAAAETLAQQTQIPRRYLHRVLQDLVSSGLLTSRPGRGGGYEFARTPKTVTILDVVNAVAPMERIRNCPLGLTSHTRLCPLHAELDRAYAAAEQAFASTTMQDILDSAIDIRPLCENTACSSATRPQSDPLLDSGAGPST